MSLTPEEQQVREKARNDLMKCIDMQVRRDFDFMRARQYWEKVLEETPKEVLAEALSMTLATGRYQVMS
ncbi:hypothetical protein [Pseudomonas sp. HMWF006]|uniref:hypothetical protein n=1 Tax=Pseudomonas sp. HMWF006 TaxID=2056843 RepID=UPI000D422FFD|nr:hypothetical protein [Pseudomonas sp. HMWF006]PTT02209.1 hypothetical protein DBR24_07290 [Pseudomonas sp. HMWF006]PTT72885.1 hypothetical protein DBR26_04260 [Pseudomonas sp. HMWF007]PTT94652.1 hypothetical protein DBR29_02860 [Pseudomonas sp. HMWF005]